MRDAAAFLGAGPPPIEDYALIGDGRSAALVSRAGSIDWLCWPRFDSPACFAALLGAGANGAWRIAPDAPTRVSRRYVGDTMVLETTFETATGVASVTDFMPVRCDAPSLVRLISGVAGRVELRLALAPRFGYGATEPVMEATAEGDGLRATAPSGAEAVTLCAPVPLVCDAGIAGARFAIAAGQRLAFTLAHTTGRAAPASLDAEAALADTLRFWQSWAAGCQVGNRYQAATRRSLLTLKALTHRPTGAIVAAPTTSLPEQLGGGRNWDYRYCWLRDAALTLGAFMQAGSFAEARAWRDWLVGVAARAGAARMQTLYGLGGEALAEESVATWLPGYQGAQPVRIGNAAHDQLQLDIYGEVMLALDTARTLGGIGDGAEAWRLERRLLDELEPLWNLPDESIWEVRGPRRAFTFSRIMAWVAFDRAVRTARRLGLPGPVARWDALRQDMHAQICREGFDPARGSFVQSFGGRDLDASLLLISRVGFLPAGDPRVRGTVAAIERELVEDGFVRRYDTASGTDGLPPGEGAFLPCSFWLADAMAQEGRVAQAEALFDRLLALRNDVGLLAEEYDPRARRLTGNFPQAFTHVALIGTAFALERASAL